MAIVTGANKGIGFALVKHLAKMGLCVILTARDLKRGSMAVEELISQGLFVHFFKLDVSDPASIFAFVAWFRDYFGALDILVSTTTTTTSYHLLLIPFSSFVCAFKFLLYFATSCY